MNHIIDKPYWIKELFLLFESGIYKLQLVPEQWKGMSTLSGTLGEAALKNSKRQPNLQTLSCLAEIQGQYSGS